ncbi:hypothetical protein Tco_1154119 [Tanacetum coccineum]
MTGTSLQVIFQRSPTILEERSLSRSSSAYIGAENIRKMEHEVPNKCDNITDYEDSDQEDGRLLGFPNFFATNEFANVCEQGKDNIDVNTAQRIEKFRWEELNWCKNTEM